MILKSKKYSESKHGKEIIKKFKQKLQKKARKTIHQLKINGCSICGYNKCDGALHFHHVMNDKKNINLNASSILYYSPETVFNELNKCILICCNCHQEIHLKERHK